MSQQQIRLFYFHLYVFILPLFSFCILRLNTIVASCIVLLQNTSTANRFVLLPFYVFIFPLF